MNVTVKIDGMDAVLKELRVLGAEAPKALEAGLYQSAEAAATAAKRLVPVDTGVLRSTIRATLPKWEGSVVSVIVGAGGPAGSGGPIIPRAGSKRKPKPTAGYAEIVHEDLFMRHDIGQAKYLEVPVNIQKAKAADVIRKEIMRRLGRRVS